MKNPQPEKLLEFLKSNGLDVSKPVCELVTDIEAIPIKTLRDDLIFAICSIGAFL